MLYMALAACLLLGLPAAFAQCRLEQAIGFTIAAEKTVTGYIENGARKDGFEGCAYDRILVFQDGTGLTCSGYTYHYAYNPTAILLVNRSQTIKACIDGEWYDLQPLR